LTSYKQVKVMVLDII